MKKIIMGAIVMSIFISTFPGAFATGNNIDFLDENIIFAVSREVFIGDFTLAENGEVLYTYGDRNFRNIRVTKFYARKKATAETELLFETRNNGGGFSFNNGRFFMLTNTGIFTCDINGEDLQLIVEGSIRSFAVSDSSIFYSIFNHDAGDSGRFQIIRSDLDGSNRVVAADGVVARKLTIVDGGAIFSNGFNVGKVSDNNQVDIFITNRLVPMLGGHPGTHFVVNDSIIISGYPEPEEGKYGAYPTIILDLYGNVVTVWENTLVYSVGESNGRIYANINNVDEDGQVKEIEGEDGRLRSDGGVYYISRNFTERHRVMRPHRVSDMYINENNIFFRGWRSWVRGDVMRDGTIENLVDEPFLLEYVNNIEVLVMDSNPVVEILDGGGSQYRGELLTLDAPPIAKDGNVLLPVRRISESLGLAVGWDEASRTVTIENDDVELRLQVGGNVLHKNDREIVLDVSPELIDSRVFVPLEVVTEGFGAHATWNEELRSVWIWSGEEPRVVISGEW